MEFEKALAEEIERLKARLQHLVGLSSTRVKTKRGRPAKKSKASRKTKRKTSPALRAQRVLQGQYMGQVRRLTSAQKKRVSAIREKSGYTKAIAEAKRMGTAKK